jgi:hypothetical protein
VRDFDTTVVKPVAHKSPDFTAAVEVHVEIAWTFAAVEFKEAPLLYPRCCSWSIPAPNPSPSTTTASGECLSRKLMMRSATCTVSSDMKMV